MNTRQWSIVFYLMIGITSINAGISGKIVGQVSSKNTGEPLIGVNVIIQNTNYGTASNLQGFFMILNVPPGIYSVKCSAIGYKTMTIEDVSVSIDLTTRINFPMEQTVVEMKEVVVIKHRKSMVAKDLTASTSIVNADEIDLLPVKDVSELLNMQAGMIEGHARGGRSGEIMYAVDGVPMTDVYDGSQVIEVNKNMINELQFVSGAFNAEYGRAMSGYVNIVTKDADNALRMGIDTYNGDYYDPNTDVFRGLDIYNPFAIHNLEGYLNFPILRNRIYFFGNYRNYYTNGWINGKYVFNPWDITINRGASYESEDRYIVQSTGDNSLTPMNWEDQSYFHGKLLIKPTNKINLNYNSIIDKRDWKSYNHSYAYNPYGDFVRHNKAIINSLTMTHMLSIKTFYQAILSSYTRDYEHYVYKNPYDSRYTHYLLFQQAPTETPSFLTGGTNPEHFYRTTKNYITKLDITSQINSVNQLKAGLEYDLYKLNYKYYNILQTSGISDPEVTMDPFVEVYIPDPDNENENTVIDIYARKPMEASAYIQDKIELKNIIINIGLRYDYFDANGYILSDPTDPDIYRPKKPENIAKSMEERLRYWYNETTPKSSFSPRLGVAFPITTTGVVHFSYGFFFQAPSFKLLYQNPEFKFSEGTGNVGVAGNSDLEPEKTISGEIGLKQGLSEDMAIEVTVYFRDIRNLAGTRADEITMYGGTSWYNQYQNSDFGFVKGVIFSLDKRLSNSWSADFNYTYQIAKGNASDPNAIRNQIINGDYPEIQMIRLDFDQTHTMNFYFSYVSSDNWGFSIVGEYGSGLPYTPDQSLNLSKLLTNSETKPEYVNINLNIYKSFQYSQMSFKLYAQIHNLFNRINELTVYGDSGTANYTWQEYSYAESGAPEIINSLDEYYRNPGYYSEPRLIEIGLSYDWNKK
ncbi:MAG: hypothetical protein GWP19_00705 [Planctomycetia bacterium]|nr:hypothetical protein [Planctomycetia bacterium]